MSKVRNPGSGKAPVNTPAQGPGWGGEKKGAGRGYTAPRLTGETPEAAAARPGIIDPKTGKFALTPKGEEAQRVAAEMLGKLVMIARTSEYEGNALSAAEKVMDRIWGKSKQPTELRVITRPEDLSDEELAKLEAELTRRLTERE